MTPEEASGFLNQYQPGQSIPVNEPATAQPSPMAKTQPASQTTPPQSVTSFLDQYVNPQEKAKDLPPDLTPSERMISETQQRMMTHEMKTPGPNWWEIRPEILTENVKKGFSDFAAIPGYAVDIVNWPLYKAGITPENPVGSSDMIRKGWQLLTDYQQQIPQTTAERYAGKVSEFAGASLIPGGGLVSKTTSRGILPQATEALKLREAYNIVGTHAQMPKLASPATAEELKWLIGTEAASAVTGGIGAEFGGEIGEKVGGPTGRMFGELLLGVSGGMGPIYFKTAGATIFNASKTAQSIANKKAMDSIAENTAKKQLARMIGEDPEAVKNLARTVELQKQMPGFKPNLAAATGSKGLAAEQANLDRLNIENYNAALDNINKAHQVIDNYFDQQFKLSGKRLTAPIIYRQINQSLQSKKIATEKQIEEVAAQYRRQPTAEIGSKLRELRTGRKAEIRAVKDQLYTELQKRADDLGIVDDASDLYQLAQEFIKKDSTAFQKMPSVYNKMEEVFGREIDPSIPLGDQKIMTSFAKLHSLSREVSKQYGKAQKSGDAAAEFYLGNIRELVDQKLSQFDDPIHGNFANYKKAVDNYWLNEYYNVFRKGVGGKIDYQTRWGYDTPDEKIISKLVMQPGTVKGLDEFNKVYEGLPEAQTLLRDGILDMFASETIPKGEITSKAVSSFLNKYKEIFDKLPDLRNTFMDADSITTALVNRKNNIIQKTKKFAAESVSPYARIAGFKSSDDAIEASLKEPQIMRTIIRSAKTSTEKKDITTLIANHVLDKPDPWGYLLQNQDQLAAHFNRLQPGHFQHLKNIAEAQHIMGRYKIKEPTEATARGIKDKFWEKTGTTFASAVSQLRWAYFYNKTGMYYPVVDMGSKYFYKMREGQIGKLMDRAMYDPDLSKTLSDLSQMRTIDMKGMKVQKLLSDLGRHAINNGLRAASVSSEQEPETTGLGMNLP